MTKKTSIHTQSLEIPKIILLTSKLLSFTSPKLITLFAARLFVTPIKYKIPKRESEMDRNSLQKSIRIPGIEKEVVVYEYGKSEDRKSVV